MKRGLGIVLGVLSALVALPAWIFLAMMGSFALDGPSTGDYVPLVLVLAFGVPLLYLVLGVRIVRRALALPRSPTSPRDIGVALGLAATLGALAVFTRLGGLLVVLGLPLAGLFITRRPAG